MRDLRELRELRETETETEKLPIEFAVQIISFRSSHDAIPQLHVQVSRRHWLESRNKQTSPYDNYDDDDDKSIFILLVWIIKKKNSWSLDWNWWGRAFRKEILQLMAKKSSLDSPQERRLATTEVIMRQQQIGSIRWWWWCTRKTRKERERKTGPFERSVFSDLISLTHTHRDIDRERGKTKCGEEMDAALEHVQMPMIANMTEWEESYRPLPYVFMALLLLWTLVLIAWTFNTWSKRRWQVPHYNTLLYYCTAFQLSPSFTALQSSFLLLSLLWFPLDSVFVSSLPFFMIWGFSKAASNLSLCLSLSLSVSLCHLVQRKIGNSMTDLGFFRSSKSWLQSFGFEQEQKGLELIGWVHLYIISWEQFLLQDFWETPLKQDSEQACSFAPEIDFHEHWFFSLEKYFELQQGLKLGDENLLLSLESCVLNFL